MTNMKKYILYGLLGLFVAIQFFEESFLLFKIKKRNLSNLFLLTLFSQPLSQPWYRHSVEKESDQTSLGAKSKANIGYRYRNRGFRHRVIEAES